MDFFVSFAYSFLFTISHVHHTTSHHTHTIYVQVGGRTMDFGPFGFLEAYDPGFAKWVGSGNHFAFMNQPNAGKNARAFLFYGVYILGYKLMNQPNAGVWHEVDLLECMRVNNCILGHVFMNQPNAGVWQHECMYFDVKL